MRCGWGEEDRIRPSGREGGRKWGAAGRRDRGSQGTEPRTRHGEGAATARLGSSPVQTGLPAGPPATPEPLPSFRLSPAPTPTYPRVTTWPRFPGEPSVPRLPVLASFCEDPFQRPCSHAHCHRPRGSCNVTFTPRADLDTVDGQLKYCWGWKKAPPRTRLCPSSNG